MSYELHIEKVRGEYIPAFYYYVPRLGQKGIPFQGVRIFLDCFLDPMRLEYMLWGSSSHTKLCPGAEWCYPDYNVDWNWNIKEPPFIPIDVRSLDQIMGGCCPDDYLPEDPRDILKRR
ncbi:hypothetical protein ES707_08062 [subsurface metagenome]